MQRHRRRSTAEKSNGYYLSEDLSEMKAVLESDLNYRQLKTDLEFLKIEQKLSEQIKVLINKRLHQLEHNISPANETRHQDQKE